MVADIERMPEWSPETTATAWLGRADLAEVGARFTCRNAIGRISWTTKPTIIAATPGVEFAVAVPGKAGATWRYTFAEVDGSTVVTDRSAHLRQGRETTLERPAEAAGRSTSPRPLSS